MLSLVGIARTLAFSLRRWRALKGFEQKGVIPNLHFKKIEGQARGWGVGRGGQGQGQKQEDCTKSFAITQVRGSCSLVHNGNRGGSKR